jgi:hypothetical protein
MSLLEESELEEYDVLGQLAKGGQLCCDCAESMSCKHKGVRRDSW